MCPHSGLTTSDLSCPSCGTDLTVLRRVQEFPLALLDQGIMQAAEGNRRAAGRSFRGAAAFPQTRERALLLLGGLAAEQGRLRSAARHWRAAARLGESGVPGECLSWLEQTRASPRNETSTANPT